MLQTFGFALKDWRGRRRMSQLDLGLEADVSARHISFLESGRSKPSRDMVLHLSDVLEVPREASNSMLVAAGFAPAYTARKRDADELKPLMEAIEWTISRHEPYPAFVIDRHWVLQRMNRPATMLFGGAGLGEGHSMLDALIENPGLRAAIEDIGNMVLHLRSRLRTEISHLGGDAVLERAVARIEALPEYQGQTGHGATLMPAVIPAKYRAGEVTLSLISTIAQFGTAEDLTLADLRIELLFPADAATKVFFEALPLS